MSAVTTRIAVSSLGDLMTKPLRRARMMPGTPKLRVSPEDIAGLSRRMTPRDGRILDAVWEHRTLTTDQVARIFFPDLDRARHRLLKLYRLRALDRFRPWAPVGSRPWHWVLGPAGAHYVAAQRGTNLRSLRYRPDVTMAISLSSKLFHQVGVNEFFASLHAAASELPGSEVQEWWSERRCAELWGDLARPDAFGRWHEYLGDGRPVTVDFFLEYDNGTETLARVAAKLDAYRALAEATGINTPVLFWLPNATRETNLRKLMASTDVPAATAVHVAHNAPHGPAGPVWLPGRSSGPRVRLTALRDTHTADTDPRDHGTA